MDNSDEKILIETKERSITNQKRLDIIEEELKGIKSEQRAIYEIASSVKVLVERVGHIESKVDDTSRKIDEQTANWHKAEEKLSERITKNAIENDHKTAENVNALKLAIITALCTALATGVLTTLLHF